MSRTDVVAELRTRAFARVIGPFVAIATVIIAIRLPDLTGLLDDLFANQVLPWMLGATMLLAGLIVIAFHQYWRGLTAVLISLFGWFVALRGLAMMAVPSAVESGAGDTLASPGVLAVARIFFLFMTAVGLWLTYAGWATPTPVDNSSAPAA